MVLKQILRLGVLCCAGFLMGCEQKTTYSYLMTHPKVLKQAVLHCQTLDASNLNAQCKVVMKAANELISFINQLQDDPEAFGQQIMEAQLVLESKKQQIISAQRQDNLLIAQGATPEVLAKSKQKLTTIKEIVEKNQLQINILLGIAGMNSPG